MAEEAVDPQNQQNSNLNFEFFGYNDTMNDYKVNL